jgi:hypothetical protein
MWKTASLSFAWAAVLLAACSSASSPSPPADSGAPAVDSGHAGSDSGTPPVADSSSSTPDSGGVDSSQPDTATTDTGAGNADTGTADGARDGGSIPGQASIGASGGTVSFGGATVTIPAGALTTTVTITIAPSAASPSTGSVVGEAFEMGPEGQQFAMPVTVTLPFNPADVPQGMTASNVVVMTAPQGSTTFTSLPTTVVDSTHVSATSSHFSAFVPVVP